MSEYNKIYYRKNREKIKVQSKRWREEHKDYFKEWRKNHREHYNQLIREWQKRNPDKDYHKGGKKVYLQQYWKNHKEEMMKNGNEYRKQRRKIDVMFRLNECMSSTISGELRGKKVGRKWQKLVGYTIKDLMNHLEKQFDNKMSWENYGSYWWVDHKKPKSLFKFTTFEDQEFKDCWALVNLQPMEKIANIQKGNKY